MPARKDSGLTAVSLLSLVALLVLAIGALAALRVGDVADAMRQQSSGWLMIATLGLLALPQLRRRQRLHRCLGAFVIVIFFAHTGIGLPTGLFEGALWWVFIAAAVTGIVQARSPTWELVHIPLFDVLLVLAIVHTLLVLHTFGGALR